MGDIVEMKNVNTVEDVNEDVIDFEKLEVVEREIPYSKIVDFIEFVKVNSFGKDRKYHEYLMDYSEAVAILTMYTNCDSYNFKFDDTMKFIQSDKWGKIKEELGETYINFHYYVKKEIEYLNTPLRFADDMINKTIEAVSKMNELLGAIDINALKNYDFTKIANAIDAVEAKRTEKQ